MNDQHSRRARQLVEAKFDPRLKTYSYVGGIILFIVTIFGIVLLPFWLIFGKIYIDKHFNSLYCELTTRALHFKKGVWFQTERTVPLDKIQDLTFKEGPILRYFGLSYLKIETAGQSVQGAADMSLTGIIDARKFREMVLDQRDEITDKSPDSAQTQSADENDIIPLLNEIHKTLKSIESKVG
ncbi:MAG: PH domain-containing protein [Balneolaceae bacterium]|nr:PH domain-containing protein [Balneolaceae bacterium]